MRPPPNAFDISLGRGNAPHEGLCSSSSSSSSEGNENEMRKKRGGRVSGNGCSDSSEGKPGLRQRLWWW